MSNRQQIDVSYGLPTDFFRLWLDRRMAYSGALFLDGIDDLEAAQTAKLAYHCRSARVRPESRVLDIGCGWGSLLGYLAHDLGVRDAEGITLCREQCDEVERLALPGVRVQCVSYEDYTPAEPFDAVISIGMFEHLATPEQARSGESIELYRRYFRKVWEWTRPGAWFSLQSVIGARIPRGKVLRDLAWGTTSIFPGAIAPRMETIFRSVSPCFEIVEFYDRREHYARTSAAWLDRLCAEREQIVERWGEPLYDEYERYLRVCVTVFSESYQSLGQIVLRRVDREPAKWA